MKAVGMTRQTALVHFGLQRLYALPGDPPDLGCLAMRDHEVALRAESLRRGRRNAWFCETTQAQVCKVMPYCEGGAHPPAGASLPAPFCRCGSCSSGPGDLQEPQLPFPRFQRH